MQGPAGEKGDRGDSDLPFYDDKHIERVRVAFCVSFNYHFTTRSHTSSTVWKTGTHYLMNSEIRCVTLIALNLRQSCLVSSSVIIDFF